MRDGNFIGDIDVRIVLIVELAKKEKKLLTGRQYLKT